ncbi:MAG: GNAT family N-acetyltransferase [Clostridia bacterium]|nr:GNAT family N-acetyltransferase [Clostridia bacterium]
MIYQKIIEGKYVDLKYADLEDAEAILKLRNDPNLSKYLTKFDSSVEQQKEWLRQQQKQEGDYYFVIWSKDNRVIGTIRAYHIVGDEGETGSLVMSGNLYEKYEAKLLCEEFVFETLRLAKTRNRVMYENKNIINFAESFGVYWDEPYADENGIWWMEGHNDYENSKKHREKIKKIIYSNASINQSSATRSSEMSSEHTSDRIFRILSKSISGIDFRETNLMKNHKIDSLILLNIIQLISNEFSILIPFEEITDSNFQSIQSMSLMMQRIIDNKHISSVHTEEKNYLPTNDDYVLEAQDSLIQYVKEHARINPNKIAIFSDQKEYTYATLYQYALKYGSFLTECGLRRGERVVVKAMQSIHYVIIYLGIHYAGGVVSTVEYSSNDDKILEIAADIEARYIITDHNPANNNSCCFINSATVFEDLKNTEIKNQPFPQREDSADILFTTGTTGASKGVELSHMAVIAGAENIAYGCEMSRSTVLVVPNPLSHSNAIKNMAACLITGCSFYLLDGITDLKAFFEALDCTYGKVATVLPPAAIRTIFRLAMDKFKSYSGQLDYLMAATAPLPEPDRETLREILPHTRLYNHYGCSESSSICIYDFNQYSDLKNCVGKAMPHSRVFFVDEAKNELNSSATNIGLLAVEGDATMKGYLKAPELTAEIKRDQIIYTKDMGYIDENGFVFILGRNDDIINVGGLKVSPLDVEAAALSDQGCADCICIGVNDEITGQALRLLVVPGQTFDLKNLQKVLADQLEGYKIPKQIEIVDQIERTYNGKLNRKAYR